jgi:uncharacterized membrane protein
MENSSVLFYSLGGLAAKLVHIFGAVIWIGGVLFMGGIATPILKYYSMPEHADPRVAEVVGLLERRLVGFNWMALWANVIGGLALTLFSSSFSWFRFGSVYAWVIHLKVLLVLPIMLTNFLLAASYRELESARGELAEGEDISPRGITEWRIVSLRRINVYLAFIIIILVAFL